MRGNFIYKKIGGKILVERKKKRFSQELLADVSHMDRTYLARIEEGKANPSVRVLHKIARNLGVKIYQLFNGV